MSRTARSSSGTIAEPSNSYIKSYCDFLSQNTADLAVVTTVDDAAVDLAANTVNAANIAAARLAPNTLTVTDWAADAAGSLYLPKAEPGAYCVLELGDMDANNALTIFTRGAADATTTAVFARHYVYNQVGYGTNDATDQQILMSGTYAVPTAIKLIYTPAATADNMLGAGDSFLYFFCATADEWLVRVVNRTEGTGADGTWTQATS